MDAFAKCLYLPQQLPKLIDHWENKFPDKPGSLQHIVFTGVRMGASFASRFPCYDDWQIARVRLGNCARRSHTGAGGHHPKYTPYATRPVWPDRCRGNAYQALSREGNFLTPGRPNSTEIHCCRVMYSIATQLTAIAMA